jgi:hypothetical protein
MNLRELKADMENTLHAISVDKVQYHNGFLNVLAHEQNIQRLRAANVIIKDLSMPDAQVDLLWKQTRDLYAFALEAQRINQ